MPFSGADERSTARDLLEVNIGSGSSLQDYTNSMVKCSPGTGKPFGTFLNIRVRFFDDMFGSSASRKKAADEMKGFESSKLVSTEDALQSIEGWSSRMDKFQQGFDDQALYILAFQHVF